MKNTLLFFLFLLPAVAWAQKDLVIEGPNDKVASVTLQVKSDFDQDKGMLKLTITGDNTAESNALWILQEACVYAKLEKYFKQNEGKLSVSSFAKEQIKFMNLGEKTADAVLQITGAQVIDKVNILTKEGVKAQIQKQILPLDNRSSLVLNLQVAPETKTVTLTLKSPLLLHGEGGKYDLTFVGKEVSIDFDVTIDYCKPHAEMLTQLKEYNKVFGKGEAVLHQAQNSCIDKVKSLLISELTQVNLKRFENTKCEAIETELDTLKALFDRITNFELQQEGGSSVSGGVDGSSTPTAPMAGDCNVKKVNEDLKAAVVKMNTYANDWMSATDPTVKQAKKVAFDSLIKETDAAINALSPACKKKVDDTSLKNYEMAKKLIKN